MKGSELVVRALEAQGVRYIFTVPGASIDPILDVLVDGGPEIILCRHEQNAAFMAANWGRITGTPGVCLATAGPGLTNLMTGIATADAERCPVVALTGQVARPLQFKRAHQNIDAVNLFAPSTKWSVGASSLESLPDLLANAFRIATQPRQGPVHLSIPSDLLTQSGDLQPLSPCPTLHEGVAEDETIRKAAALINGAKSPVLFLGMGASEVHATEALRHFLLRFEAPIVATFEAAGAVPRSMVERFAGRIGLFRNQIGNRVLAEADLILTIGYDPVECDPSLWNRGGEIVHVDRVPATLEQAYQPCMELIGEIGSNLAALGAHLVPYDRPLPSPRKETDPPHGETPIHPLRLIQEMRQTLSDEVTVISDTGSHQYWMARHYLCFEPRHFLTSMGFQTMGVSLPWAISAALARPERPVVSVSGDGSFLMCSMELETAVRLALPIVHMVWEDGSYDLVRIQQLKKYGRDSAAHFGPIDTVAYAESMGARGMRIETADQIRPVLEEALGLGTPVVISVPVDYSDNKKIVEDAVHAV